MSGRAEHDRREQRSNIAIRSFVRDVACNRNCNSTSVPCGGGAELGSVFYKCNFNDRLAARCAKSDNGDLRKRDWRQRRLKYRGTDTNIIDTIMTGISEKLPEFWTRAAVVTKIANGIVGIATRGINYNGGRSDSKLRQRNGTDATCDNAKGAELILKLVNGIITNLPQIASAAEAQCMSICSGDRKESAVVLQSGIEIIGKLAAGLIRAIPNLIAQIPDDYNQHKK